MTDLAGVDQTGFEKMEGLPLVAVDDFPNFSRAPNRTIKIIGHAWLQQKGHLERWPWSESKSPREAGLLFQLGGLFMRRGPR